LSVKKYFFSEKWSRVYRSRDGGRFECWEGAPYRWVPEDDPEDAELKPITDLEARDYIMSVLVTGAHDTARKAVPELSHTPFDPHFEKAMQVASQLVDRH
jgi:hypothetical protein